MTFSVQYPVEDIPSLVAQYMSHSGPDDEEMERAGRRIASHTYAQKDFETICEWKSKRRMDLIRLNSQADIRRGLTLAIGATTPREAISALTPIRGVGVKMATAVLTAIDPERYTVLDVRALEALGCKNSNSVTLYLSYLDFCQRFAKNHGIRLREFDRANWQWSRNKSARSTCGARNSCQLRSSPR